MNADYDAARRFKRGQAADADRGERTAASRQTLHHLAHDLFGADLPRDPGAELFELLAATGLRISEVIGLQWRHVALDGSRPQVKVRRRIVRGKVGPPKSRHSRRDVPLPWSLVAEMRTWRRETEWPGGDDLVFPTTVDLDREPDRPASRLGPLTPVSSSRVGGASAAVVERVAADFDAHLDRLLRYMRQPSVSATGEGIDAMCAMLAEDARELGGTAEIAPGSEFPVVLCRFDVGAPRTLVVHLMYDVAPAEEPEWVVAPFSATRMPWRGLGDCIVGRGAEDTKSEIAMIYNVIATYRAAGRPLPVNVILVQEASELGSGSIEEVVRQRRDLFRAADVAWWPFISGRPDGTPVVYLGAKGLVTGKFRCRGGAWGGPVKTSVHSMHANWIANPAEVLVQALGAMRRDGDVAIPGFYGDYPGPAPEEVGLIDRLVDQVSEADVLGELGVERFAQDDLREALYAYCFRSELNISGLSAGVTLERAHKCVIPTEAVASVDMRPVGQSLEDMYAAIDAFLAERFPAVSWEPLNGYVGDRVPLDSWPVQRMLQVYADMGTTPQVWPCMAAAIAVGLWTRDVGIPWIAGMPGHAAGKHAANEHIVVDGFRQACEFGVRLVAKLGADA